jgi:hypothetical protein
MQVFKVLTIIKNLVICIQSESGLHQPMKAKVGLIRTKNIMFSEIPLHKISKPVLVRRHIC